MTASNDHNVRVTYPSFCSLPDPATLPNYTVSTGRSSGSAYAAKILEGSPFYHKPHLFSKILSKKEGEGTIGWGGEERTAGNTVVIVPGSQQVKIGLCGDAFPSVHPQVVAIVAPSILLHADEQNNDEKDQPHQDQDGLMLTKKELDGLLEKRQRPSPGVNPSNIYASLTAFNRACWDRAEDIPFHNDPYATEWITSSNRTRFHGSEVESKFKCEHDFSVIQFSYY